MPSLRLVRQVSSKDIIAGLITGLEALQEVSDSISAVPFLGSIVSAALGIAKTVERIRGDRERYVRLARRVSDLSRHVHESVAADPHAMDENLKINLIELQVLLKEIQTDVECELRRKPLSRFLLQNSIAEKLEDRINQLDYAWHSFDTACLIAMSMKLYRQALYDDQSQLRLFRWSDLRCTRVRGKHIVSGCDVGQEWEGRWEGRAVVVRTIRPQYHDTSEGIIGYYPNIHHPHVAQVIGLSHPSLSERFYVMDTGVMPLIHQFRGKDTLSRLLQWLQHVIDYQNAFHHLESLEFPVSEFHSHDRCLPSAMLNEEGGLIIDAADFCNSNLGCFQSCLRTLYDEEHGALSPGKDYANDDDVITDASTLLTLLRSHLGANSGSPDMTAYLQSDLTKLWASHQFQGDVEAQWSDYGYIKRDGTGETFVRLGNIYDVVRPTGKLTTFLLRRYGGCDWERAEDFPWPERIVSHVFELSDGGDKSVEDIAVVRTLPDDGEYHDFFWNHAEAVAAANDLHVHDIVLFEETFHYAGAALYDDEFQSTASASEHENPLYDLPDRIYFHQLPLMASGETPTPWGYWSLDAEPTPGPWPCIELPGVELTCRMKSNYARVSTFEAEVLVYLNQLRRNRTLNTPTPPSTRGRFEEIR